MVKLNIVKERLVYLAPAVQAGWDDESCNQDFELLKVLGRGSFGVVKKVRHKKTHKTYALKELDKKEIKDRRMTEQVRNEIKIMYSLNHPNIIKLYSHFEDDLHISLLLEFAERGQLYQSLMTNPAKKFTEIEVAKIVYQLIDAMKYMHEKHIVHRDIKPENILLDAQGNTKLADFGWSNYIVGQGKRTTYCGTLDYLAPQMIEKDHKHDHAIDLWAIGILIYELSTGTSPFSANISSRSQVEIEKQVKHNIMTLNYKVPNQLSSTCKDLLSKLLVIKPSERLTIPGIKQHSWMKAHFVTTDNKKPNWTEQLKSEYSQIMEFETKKEEKEFSHDEIYECNRPDSIIRAKKQPKTEAPDNSFTSDHSQPSPQGHNHKHTNSALSLNSMQSNPVSLSKFSNDVEFSGKDIHKLLEHIRELERKVQSSEAQVKKLKESRQQDHSECEKRRTEIEAKYATLRKKYDTQFLKLASSEARVRQLELQIANSHPVSPKTEPVMQAKR